MADTMVTARMSATKKDAGNRILESLGSNASKAINGLYDYLVEKRALPWEDADHVVSPEDAQLREAFAWIDGLSMSLSPEFAAMTTKDARHARLKVER